MTTITPAANHAAPRVDDALLEATGVSAGYGAVPVVEGIDIAVRPGEIVALLGANGAGKSTTMMTLAGILRPSAGEVRWRGEVVKAPIHVRARDGLAYVPEQRSIISSLTTLDNLRLGRGPVDAALDLFPELKALLGRRAGLLSGGEQQILTLARALASSPRVLLADELSLGLAPLIVTRLLNAVREAAARGVGVLLVEQQIRHALVYADRAVVLQRGRIALAGSSDEILRRLDDVEATYFASGPAAELPS
ncbi:MAG: ABC transporter ATP-binding protein [Microbacteriaceae bacterium]